MKRIEQLQKRYDMLFNMQKSYIKAGDTLKFWRANGLALDVLSERLKYI